MRLLRIVLALFPIVLSVTANAQQPPFPWRFEEVVTLDTGVPEALVGDMGASTIDGSGRVSFLCRRSHIIYRFDSDGSWLGNIDRKGNGPGEFQQPLAIAASWEGDLLINDNDTMRITHLTPDGDYIASFNLSNLEISGAQISSALTLEIAFAGPDHYWVSHYLIDRDRQGTSDRIIALVDRDGRAVWSREYKELDLYIAISPSGSPGGSWFSNPAAHDARWKADSGGSAWIISPDCQLLTVVSGDGEVAREVPLQLPELALSRQDWRAHLSEIRTRDLAVSEGSRELSQLHFKAIEGLRDELPPLQRVLWAGPDGILIDRYARFRGPEKAERQLTAILPDGRMTEDSIELDVRLGPFYNGYTLCNLSESGELPHIVVYRITPR